MEVPEHILEAAEALAIEQGNIQRDPARRDSPEFDGIIARRRTFVQALREQGYDDRAMSIISKHVATIPPHAYDPTLPEPEFVMERPPEDQIRQISVTLSADVVQLFHHAPEPVEALPGLREQAG